jgi:putative inorganic carbon (HCO3(-)) transporter
MSSSLLTGVSGTSASDCSSAHGPDRRFRAPVSRGAGARPIIGEACAAAAAGPLLAFAALITSLTRPLVSRFLLALVVLDIPLQANKNFAYLEGVDEFGALGGFEISVTTIALVLLYVRWVLLLAASPAREQIRPAARISRPLVWYLGFATLSTITAGDVSLSLRELFLLGELFLLYVYLVNWVRTSEDLRFVMAILLMGLAIESLMMVYGAYVGDTLWVGGLRIRVDTDAGVVRVGGTVGPPNSAAAYLTLLIAPALSVLLTNAARSTKVIATCCAALGAMAMVPTQSRGGWLAALLSLGFLWIATARRDLRTLAVPIVTAILIALVVALAGDTITTRLTSDDQGSAQSRFPLMQTAMEIIRDQPILGVGPNNYSTAMKQYGAVYGYWGDWVYTVHNKFLLVWAETGLGGLVSFIWFLAATINLGWKGWSAGDPLWSPLALGFTGAVIGHAVHLNLDMFNARSQVELLWVVAALLAVIHAGAQKPGQSGAGYRVRLATGQ